MGTFQIMVATMPIMATMSTMAIETILTLPESPLTPFLARFPAVILDGGLATELERRGADLADPLWSARVLVEAPELIHQVHLDYFLAGADVATTASYQATFAGFAGRGIGREEAADLLRLSVSLAERARDDFWSDPRHRTDRIKPLVAASIGSYGAQLADGSEYRGDFGLSVAALVDYHRPKLAVLADSGADLVAFETIPSLAEGEAIVRLMAEFPLTRAWLSFSCGDERHVCHGEPLAECVALADGVEQIAAVGVNCTAPEFIIGLLEAARQVTRKPLVAYPNRGDAWDSRTRHWVPDVADVDWDDLARAWHAAGARLIGGCCRTAPEDVRAIRAALIPVNVNPG